MDKESYLKAISLIGSIIISLILAPIIFFFIGGFINIIIYGGMWPDKALFTAFAGLIVVPITFLALVVFFYRIFNK